MIDIRRKVVIETAVQPSEILPVIRREKHISIWKMLMQVLIKISQVLIRYNQGIIIRIYAIRRFFRQELFEAVRRVFVIWVMAAIHLYHQ